MVVEEAGSITACLVRRGGGEYRVAASELGRRPNRCRQEEPLSGKKRPVGQPLCRCAAGTPPKHIELGRGAAGWQEVLSLGQAASKLEPLAVPVAVAVPRLLYLNNQQQPS